MKNNLLHIYGILGLMLIIQITFAQELDVLQGPKQLEPPTEEILGVSLNDILNSGLGNTGKYWDVYTIRNNVPCYGLPNNSIKIHTLPFLEKLYVNEVKGDYIHVYKPIKEWVLNNEDIEDYGWINKVDLLLWRHCVVTDVRKKIAIKGMILNKIGYITNKSGSTKVKGEPKNDVVPYYLDPYLKEKSGDYSQMFNILYIYDTYPPNSSLEESTSVLLGRNDIIMANIKDNIKGWVPTARVTFWKHRVAVEMNADKEAVEERKMNETPVLIFANDEKGKKSALKYGNSQVAPNKVKLYTFKGNYDENRKLGTWMRFPILKNDIESNIYDLGVMGEITTETGESLFKSEIEVKDKPKELSKPELTGPQIIKRMDSLRILKRNVNIVFVVDGTSSMGPYFNALANTLANTISDIEVSNPKNVIRYGAVVYRDAAEKDRLIENAPLNASKDKLVNFFKSIDTKDRYDNDKPEALFYGLKNALLSQFTSNDETNIIILIGDAGNHTQTSKTKVDPKFLSNLIYQRKCSVLAYQVHNEGDQTYFDFQNQIKDILQNSADKTYADDSKLFDATGVTYEIPQFVEKEKNTFVLEGYPPNAIVVFSPLEGKIEPEVLSSKIKEIIAFSQNYLEEIITRFKAIQTGKSTEGVLNGNEEYDNEISASPTTSISTIKDTAQNKYVSSYAPGLIQMLGALNLSDETLKKLCTEKFQLYTRGIAPKQILGQTYPLFKRNLLLSNVELIQIVNDIKLIAEARSNDERRNSVVNAWIGLLRKYYGNENEADLKKMKIEEIQQKVFGINPESGNILNKYTLQQLMDPASVSDIDLSRYLAHMEKKYDRLNKITNNKNYKYQFYIDEKTFYWISEDYLP